jgi:hypothetical protein
MKSATTTTTVSTATAPTTVLGKCGRSNRHECGQSQPPQRGFFT